VHHDLDVSPLFGRYEDAMWPGEPWLYHSQLSAALNLKLLNAREVVAAAEVAYREGHVPLQSAEGFIRQILGWREYVRGIYWTQMPSYIERNALNAEAPFVREFASLEFNACFVGHFNNGAHVLRLLHDKINFSLT
jgi:deoxyribodipyrimidine photolyase-like uncharacterized protein